MLERFADWVLRRRFPIVLVTVLLTLAGAYATVRFARIEADISKLLPRDDPAVVLFDEAGEIFGGTAVGMVGVEFENVFQTDALALIDRVTKAIGETEGVAWVTSLTAMDDVQRELIEGERAVSVRKIIDPARLPSTPEALSALRTAVLSRERLVGVVVSADARLANLTFAISKDADRVETAQRVEAVVRAQCPQRTLYFAGFPFWMKELSRVVLRDMAVLVPIVALIVILVLFLSFRTVRGVVLPMLTVVIGSVWTLGLMSLLGIPITMLSNTIPVMMIALGTAYAIHLLHREADLGPVPPGERTASLRRTLVEVFVPILGAGVTTVVGFLSFMTTNLTFVRDFGLMAAFGILVVMGITVTFLPAVLSWLPARRSDVADLSEGRLAKLLVGLGHRVARRPRTTIAIAAVVSIISGAFIPNLERRFNMVAYFDENSEVQRADRMMREKLGGNVPIWIMVDGDPKEPFVLQQMLQIEKYLRTIPDISNVKSVASFIAEMNEAMTDHLGIPETRDGVGNLWFNLEGKSLLDQFADRKLTHALIQAVTTSADTARLRVMVAEIEAFLAQIPARARRIDLDTAEPELAQRARAARMSQIVLAARLDLKYRAGVELDPKQIEQTIQETLKTDTVDVDSLRAPLLDFLRSDEADLELTDLDAEALARAVAEAARTGSPGAKEIENIVRRVVAHRLLAEDKRAVEFLAFSLHDLLTEVIDSAQVGTVVQGLIARVPAERRADRTDRMLRSELEGDLWPLRARTAWLPVGPAEPLAQGEGAALVLHQTGMHQISVNVDNNLVWSQLSSLGLAALVAFLFLMLQFRSFWAGLLSLVPMTITLLINFGVMAALNIPLETSTVLIASLVVGVGIDYPIHFLSHTGREVQHTNDVEGAVQNVQATVSRAIVINALTVLLGQLVFLAANLAPLHYFGALLALAMATAALSAITVIPAVILLARPKFLFRASPAVRPDA